MKLPTIKLKLSIAAVAVAFLAGTAVVAAQANPKSQDVRLADSTTPTSQDSTTTATDHDTTPAADDATQSQTPAADSSEQSSESSATTPTGSSSSSSDDSSGSTSGSTDTTGTDDQTPSSDDPAPAVTAVSAAVSGWTDPAPTASRGGVATPNGYIPYPTTVKYRYCVWSYSDGSTQRALFMTEYTVQFPGGSTSGAIQDNLPYNCDVAHAPAAS